MIKKLCITVLSALLCMQAGAQVFIINDILNQTRSLTHTVTANYEEDSYRLIMGRYILFGVKWNFGKMNAAHSQRAQQAAWNMVF